jgi:spermidine synthase
VKPFELLAESFLPDGTVIKLTRRGDEYLILAAGAPLMTSRMHRSEDTLATLACQRARCLKTPAILIGGLGMGFTLRATLDLLPAGASIVVAELAPAVVEWNRGPISHLAKHPLNDKRVRVATADVAEILNSSVAQFDAVILDVDNGPAAFTVPANSALYDRHGLAAAHQALKPDGLLAVWAIQSDFKFVKLLRAAQFEPQAHHVRGHTKKRGPRHTVYLARKL